MPLPMKAMKVKLLLYHPVTYVTIYIYTVHHYSLCPTKIKQPKLHYLTLPLMKSIHYLLSIFLADPSSHYLQLHQSSCDVQTYLSAHRPSQKVIYIYEKQ